MSQKIEKKNAFHFITTRATLGQITGSIINIMHGQLDPWIIGFFLK